MSEEANLNFAKPEFTYDELEAQLEAYVPQPGHKHEHEAIICLEESIRSGRIGNVAVGGCLFHNDGLIHRDVSKAVAPYHRTDPREAGEQTNWDRLPPGFRGLGDRLVVEEADCSPELKELSRQIWLISIGPAVQAFRDRY